MCGILAEGSAPIVERWYNEEGLTVNPQNCYGAVYKKEETGHPWNIEAHQKTGVEGVQVCGINVR